MADRNLNDPTDPQQPVDEDRPTWDLDDPSKNTEDRPDLIDPTPETDVHPVEPAAQPEPALSEAGVDTQALADDDLQIDEGAAAFGDDQPEDIIGTPEAEDWAPGDPETYGEPDSYAVSEGGFGADAETRDEGRFESNTHAGSDSYRDTDAYADRDDYAGTDAYANRDAYASADEAVALEAHDEPARADQTTTWPADESADGATREDSENLDVDDVEWTPVEEPRDHTMIPHPMPVDNQEIPRDVLERRNLGEDDYERRREVPDVAYRSEDDRQLAGENYRDAQTPATLGADGEDEVAYTQEEIYRDDPRPTSSDAQYGDSDAQTLAGAAAMGGAAGVAASFDDEEDLETTKVRRQSLLSPEDQTTTQEVEEPNAEATSSWHPVGSSSDVRGDEGSLFDDATVVPEVPSRTGARVWSFVLTLLGLPTAWYLITDAAARLTLADGNPVATGVINPAALIELGAGVIVAIVLVLLTIRSSLGALIFGFLLMVAGVFFLAVPSMTATFMEPAYNWLIAFNDFGGNVAHHIQWSGYTGMMFLSGLSLFVVGLTSIFARKDGRREQEIRQQIERMAPGTLTKKRRRKNNKAAAKHED